MASTAEQMASNISLGSFAKATDLKKRLWFTLGALIVFRLLSFVPLPGIDPALAQRAVPAAPRAACSISSTCSRAAACERMSLIALGVMPYITASIVMQLATTMSPQLGALKKEGESGRKKINQYTRYGTVFLCAIQGYFMAVGLESWGAQQGSSAVLDPGMMFRITTVINLVGGTMFLMWLGEQITSRGIGNGISLIIMAGIVAQLPQALAQMFEGGRTRQPRSDGDHDDRRAWRSILVLFICFMERAQRRVLIQYPKRQTARGQIQQERSHLPLKVNTVGRDPADLRLVAAADAADHRPVRRPARGGRERLGRFRHHDHHLAAARLAALHVPLRRRHRLLLLLLHRGRVQPRGDGGESQEIWRLHPRHPARASAPRNISITC